MTTQTMQESASDGLVSTDSIPAPTRLALYRSMLELRYCEKRAHDLFLQNLIKGTR
jgi:acetoin:2,6-dichlorophenolindophenol oxidoreductase subunit alpha